jgi:hypothetical protein
VASFSNTSFSTTAFSPSAFDLAGVDVKVSWICFDTAAQPPVPSSKSGVSRLWLIEYYTKAFEKKEAVTEAVVKIKLTAAEKRKRTLKIKKLAAKAEADLSRISSGIADAQAAQQFIALLMVQAQTQILVEPETDFLKVAADYRKKIQQEDDELLLLSMVI